MLWVFYCVHIFICLVVKQGIYLPKQPQNLDLSFKMGLDFWDCVEGKNSLDIWLGSF